MRAASLGATLMPGFAELAWLPALGPAQHSSTTSTCTHQHDGLLGFPPGLCPCSPVGSWNSPEAQKPYHHAAGQRRRQGLQARHTNSLFQPDTHPSTRPPCSRPLPAQAPPPAPCAAPGPAAQRACRPRHRQPGGPWGLRGRRAGSSRQPAQRGHRAGRGDSAARGQVMAEVAGGCCQKEATSKVHAW